MDISKSALLAHRAALETTGHNVANADVDGYCRQKVIMASNGSVRVGTAIMGTGVHVAEVTRAYNAYANKNVDRQTAVLGDLSAKSEYMATLETLFSESSGAGLGTRLNAFWAGWQDLANDPSGTAERLALIRQGEELAGQLDTESGTLDTIANELRLRVTQEVGDINDMLDQVANLNDEIVGVEAGSYQANDLRDQRDAILTRISEAIPIDYFEGDGGKMSVFLKGRMLVENRESYHLEPQSGSGYSVGIMWHDSLASAQDISGLIDGGELGGHLFLLQDDLAGYSAQLNDFAKALAFEVNRIHSQGVGQEALTTTTGTEEATAAGVAMATAASGLEFHDRIDDSGAAGFDIHVYGATGTPLAGSPRSITITAGMTLTALAAAVNAATGLSASVSDGKLTIAASGAEGGSSFAFGEDTSGVLAALGINGFFSGHTAGDIAVRASQAGVAAGRVSSDGSFGSGDGSNALAIADIEDTQVEVGDSTDTLSDYIGGILGDLGVEAASVKRNAEFAKSMLDQLTTWRNSESGVSLDEELSNMLKYQHAYIAAAKLLTTADEMLRAVLEIK
ncbi:MAG: flagellar hook-associated protein FlgK [Pseudomonadota bacterium]